MKTTIGILAIAALLAAGALATSPAGTKTVALDPTKKKMLVSIINPTKLKANDLHFELFAPPQSSANLNTTTTQLRDASGNSMGWKDPVAKTSAGRKFDMELGPNGHWIQAGGGAGLFLDCTTAGFTSIRYTLTQRGIPIYAHAAVSGTLEDIVTFTMQTGNRFPVSPAALTTVGNEGDAAITAVSLSVTSGQQFVEISSDFPGMATVQGATASYLFDFPVEPEQIFELGFVYNDFGPDPDVDTDVAITVYYTDLVFGAATVPTKSAAAARTVEAKKRVLPAISKTATIVTVPDFYVREVRRGGLDKPLTLSPGGAFKFVPNTGDARVVKGSAIPGKLQLASNGDLLMWAQNTGRDLNTVKISGLKIDVSKTATGPVRLYLKSRKTKCFKFIGIKK